jgi:hypothetical protein
MSEAKIIYVCFTYDHDLKCLVSSLRTLDRLKAATSIVARYLFVCPFRDFSAATKAALDRDHGVRILHTPKCTYNWYCGNYEGIISKLAAYKQILEETDADDDTWIMDADSDIFFINSTFIDSLAGDYCGFAQAEPVWLCEPLNLRWIQCSGACYFIRAGLLRKMVDVSSDELWRLRNLCNASIWIDGSQSGGVPILDDTFLSFLGLAIGGHQVLLPRLFCSDGVNWLKGEIQPEESLLHWKDRDGVYNLIDCPQEPSS